MTPRKQRPGYAAAGQFLCRRHTHDPATGHVSDICNKPVPPGELTHLAHNSPSGDYLALCVSHREELSKLVEEFVSASLGTARLLSELNELSNGQLVSDTELRERLDATNVRPFDRRGPLSAYERKTALEMVERRPPVA